MSVQNNSDLAFLDVLLVNAEKYNQVFIQKTKPAWINQTLSRLIRSPLHFNKFFEILVDMVVSERHPEWSNRAIQWLIKIFDNAEAAEMAKQCSSSMIRFVSFSAEMVGTRKLLDSTLEALKCVPRPSKPKSKKSELVILDTKYVFIDDPELNFGAFLKRSRKEESLTEAEEHEVEDEHDELSGSSDDDGASVSEDYNSSEISEDDGVFDVDRNSLSSAGSRNSATFLHPRTSRVNHIDANTDGSSDTECEDAEVGTDDFEVEDEDEDAVKFDQSPPSSGSSSVDEKEGVGGEKCES